MTTEYFQTAENSITDYYHHNHFHKRTITDKRYHCAVRYTHSMEQQMRTYITILRPLKGRYILFARRLAWQKEEEPIGKKVISQNQSLLYCPYEYGKVISLSHKCLPFSIMPYGSVHLFFCPSLILRSLSIPLLSFALLGDLLSLIFLLVGHFCSQELCRRINQVDFSIATLSKTSPSFCYWVNVWKQRQTVGFSLGIITMRCGGSPQKFVCNSHHHVGNVGPLFVLWVAYKRVQNK